MDTPEGQEATQMAAGAWISAALAAMWPRIRATADAEILAAVPALVEANKPRWMEGVVLERLTLGDVPPTVRSVRIERGGHDDFGGDAPAPDSSPAQVVRLVVDVEWHSDLDVQLTIRPLPAGLTSLAPSILKGVVDYVVSITAGVQALSVRANLLVALWLTSTAAVVAPPVGLVQATLLRAPAVDFDITLTRGESRILNLVKPWLASTVRASFEPLIAPEHVAVPLGPPDVTPDVHAPEGALLVRVVRAEGVPRMDYVGSGHSDTYVSLWARGRVRRRTPTAKAGGPDPSWTPGAATFVLLVQAQRYQMLQMELWDEDRGTGAAVLLGGATDDFIGSAALPLVDLEPGRLVTLSLPVANDGGPDVTRTRLHIEVRYVPRPLAPILADEIGAPGVLYVCLRKLTVPALGLLPVKVRPSVVGQDPPGQPPVTPTLYPPAPPSSVAGVATVGSGGMAVTTADAGALGGASAPRHDIPAFFEAIFDLLGTADHIASCTVVLEAVQPYGNKVVARVEVPMADILRRKLLLAYDRLNAWGGQYTLQDAASGIVFDVTLQWWPLLL